MELTAASIWESSCLPRVGAGGTGLVAVFIMGADFVVGVLGWFIKMFFDLVSGI